MFGDGGASAPMGGPDGEDRASVHHHGPPQPEDGPYRRASYRGLGSRTGPGLLSQYQHTKTCQPQPQAMANQMERVQRREFCKCLKGMTRLFQIRASSLSCLQRAARAVPCGILKRHSRQQAQHDQAKRTIYMIFLIFEHAFQYAARIVTWSWQPQTNGADAIEKEGLGPVDYMTGPATNHAGQTEARNSAQVRMAWSST